MTVEFGKFGLCETASYPICILYDSVVRKCTTQDYSRSFPQSADLGNFIASIVLALLAIYLMIRSYRKYAAVGRKEMYIMFGFLFVASVLQVILATGVAGDGKGGKILAAIQAGFAVGTIWTLMVNGFVGFQLIEDGTITSTLLVFGTGGIVAVVVAVFAADAGLHFTNLAANSAANASNPDGLPMWILYFIIPAICLLIYLVTQIALVLRLLGTRRPLLILLLALVAFAVAQVFYLVASNPICAGTNGAIDGSFAATILIAVSAIFLFWYWDSITEDEWDEFGVV